MSHTKPALASDPATDFAIADSSTAAAPLDLSLLREHDQGSSLMDRAQRRRATSDAIFARAHALREQAATSALPQEAQLAALDRQSQQLADAERTRLSHRRLRERYDPGEVERSLQVIAAIPDPVRQRESLTQLQASYAAFAFNPEIAQRLDRQFADFGPVVQRREGAALRAAILAGRYAPTLTAARQLYPGRKINTLMAPGSDRPLFVPERFADPDLEAEAVQVIQNAFHLAQVTGKRSHLEAALDDEAVRQVSRIPGNLASVVFGQRLASFSAVSAERASGASPQQPSPGNPSSHELQASSGGRRDFGAPSGLSDAGRNPTSDPQPPNRSGITAGEGELANPKYDPKTMKLSTEGAEFIKSWEQPKDYAPTPYDDGSGYMTIGYGHKILPGEDFSKRMTAQEALDLYKRDLEKHSKPVRDRITRPLTQYEFDALVAFAFNTGGFGKGNTMPEKINSGDIEGFLETWGKYIKSRDSKTRKLGDNNGLKNRRPDEIELFQHGDYIRGPLR